VPASAASSGGNENGALSTARGMPLTARAATRGGGGAAAAAAAAAGGGSAEGIGCNQFNE